MTNSRRKGNDAERAVATIMRTCFGGNWERKSMGITGPDILPPDWFPYVIEVKHDKAIKLKHLFQPTKLLLSYYEQAKSHAKSTDKIPLLCIKIEGMWLTVIPLTTRLPAIDDWALLTDWCEREKQLMENTIDGSLGENNV